MTTLCLTPAILSIRFGLLVSRLEEKRVADATRMCRVYGEEIQTKQVSMLSDKERNDIAEWLFEAELALLCHGYCPAYVLDIAKRVRDLIIKKLVNFVFIRNRLMDDGLPREQVGTLYDLPASFKYEVAQRLQDLYV